ncbi:hypothetical protein AMATHDRAFT_6937 [Amanita thiersii Skay4041]|uniref:Uncharacterized protein n=1 Tax=Amanita thiersii Skay4041 TaxID=703135 RepID=A0A2A9NG85_9AGAR|nr:hypothetical protein AMATHDRAFT_6937 [Amanita thiersii Skay4041]
MSQERAELSAEIERNVERIERHLQETSFPNDEIPKAVRKRLDSIVTHKFNNPEMSVQEMCHLACKASVLADCFKIYLQE